MEDALTLESEAQLSGFTHRHPKHQNHFLTSRGPDIATCYDAYIHGVKKFAKYNCFGTREVLPGGQLGPYKWLTYAENDVRANNFGSALCSLGLKPRDKMGLYSKNREEAMCASLASHLHSITNVFLYDTLGVETTEFIVNHAELSVVCCSADKVATLLALATVCPGLRYVVQFEDSPPPPASAPNGIQVLTFNSMMQRGAQNPVAHHPPKPDYLSTILYTSGTTGNPKGVMITHANIIAAAAAANAAVPLTTEDVHLSYLPMAHIFEQLTLVSGLSSGASCGFYSGDTDKLLDDIMELRPTKFIGVPRVFQKIYARIMQQVSESLWHRQKLFYWAVETKREALRKGETAPYLDALVFDKIKARLGGRVRVIISGAAPLPADLHEFLRIVFCCQVVQGYGLSESCAVATIQPLTDPASGHVGLVGPSCEVKLMSVPEMGYSVSNNPPCGEVCIRGPSVFAGYYREPQKTAEVFTPSGFFKTGDIGMWRPDGMLQIIDRKKDIFKLSQGEYVAAERIEGTMLKSKYLDQVWVYGDSEKNHLVAVCVPRRLVLATHVRQLGGTEEQANDIEALCRRKDINELVFADVIRQCKADKLAGFEIVKRIHLEPKEFGVDNGLMTPTQKLRRSHLKNYYADTIQELYSEKLVAKL